MCVTNISRHIQNILYCNNVQVCCLQLGQLFSSITLQTLSSCKWISLQLEHSPGTTYEPSHGTTMELRLTLDPVTPEELYHWVVIPQNWLYPMHGSRMLECTMFSLQVWGSTLTTSCVRRNLLLFWDTIQFYLLLYSAFILVVSKWRIFDTY